MILLSSLYSPDTLDNPTGVRSHMCRIRESLLLLLMITEDQQSYIRFMSLIELEPKEIQSQQRIRNKILFGKPQACKNMISSACYAVHFGQISIHLELSEKVKLLLCPLRQRIRVVWSRLLQSIDRKPPGREP
ncbi:hypothetical protein AVEN_223233-1 [Araneus ventricosus]|uniref:Uncharacterized protein n=1 Tax=Araneus ventricosus TaxID=182803 RepID=A0A4Y1ZXM1_ARAVE|nr:hypothetical protein AVEN_223233-1 [Araneus ventricosus]